MKLHTFSLLSLTENMWRTFLQSVTVVPLSESLFVGWIMDTLFVQQMYLSNLSKTGEEKALNPGLPLPSVTLSKF